jgi:hypothetical protein
MGLDWEGKVFGIPMGCQCALRPCYILLYSHYEISHITPRRKRGVGLEAGKTTQTLLNILNINLLQNYTRVISMSLVSVNVRHWSDGS